MSAEDILKIPSAEPTPTIAPVVVNVVVVEPAAAKPPIPPQLGEPWNVLRALYGHATATVNYAEAKENFDNTFQPVEPAPQEVPAPEPKIVPISAGQRIIVKESNYVIDRSVAARVERRRKDF